VAWQLCPRLLRQTPEASHVPAQLSASSREVTVTQVPPPPVQAWQFPQEAEPQHLPSTQ
jgi:hypothetical protein